MSSTYIDEDLEVSETKVAMYGVALFGVLLICFMIPSRVSFALAGFFAFLFFMVALDEIERRGKAITKFRERPSKMREVLAGLEHDQWVKLTKYYTEDAEIEVSDEKLGYWKDLWVDYEGLSEEMKDKDRKYADKVIEKVEEVDYY